MKLARQELVRRLDSYELEHADLFSRVVALIKERFMPIIMRHAISGEAAVNTIDPVFNEPMALAMLIDVFSERGYHARVDKRLKRVPERFAVESGEIECRERLGGLLRYYHRKAA